MYMYIFITLTLNNMCWSLWMKVLFFSTMIIHSDRRAGICWCPNTTCMVISMNVLSETKRVYIWAMIYENWLGIILKFINQTRLHLDVRNVRGLFEGFLVLWLNCADWDESGLHSLTHTASKCHVADCPEEPIILHWMLWWACGTCSDPHER